MKCKVFILIAALGLWAAVLVAASTVPAGKVVPAETPSGCAGCPHACGK